MSAQCPLSRATRTFTQQREMAEIDPKETFAGDETKVRAVNAHAPK